MGLPDVFGDVIGCCEIAGAIGLFVRRLSAAAAAGLASIMVGAVGYHLHYERLCSLHRKTLVLSDYKVYVLIYLNIFLYLPLPYCFGIPHTILVLLHFRFPMKVLLVAS